MDNVQPTNGTAITSTTPPHPLLLVQQALEKGLDPDKLGKLIDLAEQVDRRNAEKAYWESMRAAQEEMPAIYRSKQGAKSKYAPFEELNAIIRPIYTKHGFSMTFTQGVGAPEGHIRIVCDVGHEQGHVRQHFGDYPLDGEGSQGNRSAMNAIQATGSTHSYAKRYLAKDIWNLAETNEDNDGADGGLTREQVEKITQGLAEAESLGFPVNLEKFCTWLQVENMDKLASTAMPFGDIVRFLKGWPDKCRQAQGKTKVRA